MYVYEALKNEQSFYDSVGMAKVAVESVLTDRTSDTLSAIEVRERLLEAISEITLALQTMDLPK